MTTTPPPRETTEREAIVLCAECEMPMKVVFRGDEIVRVFKVCKCATPAEKLVKAT